MIIFPSLSVFIDNLYGDCDTSINDAIRGIPPKDLFNLPQFYMAVNQCF